MNIKTNFHFAKGIKEAITMLKTIAIFLFIYAIIGGFKEHRIEKKERKKCINEIYSEITKNNEYYKQYLKCKQILTDGYISNMNLQKESVQLFNSTKDLFKDFKETNLYLARNLNKMSSIDLRREKQNLRNTNADIEDTIDAFFRIIHSNWTSRIVFPACEDSNGFGNWSFDYFNDKLFRCDFRGDFGEYRHEYENFGRKYGGKTYKESNRKTTESKTQNRKTKTQTDWRQDMRNGIYFTCCYTKEDIIKRYKTLAKLLHPDAPKGDTEKFINLKKQYEEKMRLFS